MPQAKKSNFSLVKEQLHGHWAGVISNLYPAFSPALQRPGKSRIPCPVHGGVDGFRFYADVAETGGGVCNTCGSFASGIDFIMWVEACSEHEAMNILEGYLGISKDSPTPRKILPKVQVHKPDPEEERRQQQRIDTILRTIWAEALPLSELPFDHQAIQYMFRTRGIRNERLIRGQQFIRFHPKLLHVSDRGVKTSLPGIVSMFHNVEKKPVALHRTYLDPSVSDKADVDRAKKLLAKRGVPVNGAICLTGGCPLGEHINICEGVETGLSIVSAIGHPVLSATTASLVGSWKPYANTKAVTIWADRDKVSEKTGQAAGLSHSIRLRDRLSELGVKARIIVPSYDGRESLDWNDVLNLAGPTLIQNAFKGVSGSAEFH